MQPKLYSASPRDHLLSSIVDNLNRRGSLERSVWVALLGKRSPCDAGMHRYRNIWTTYLAEHPLLSSNLGLSEKRYLSFEERR